MTDYQIQMLANAGHIKAMLFLICLYLASKAVFGIFWWLYNKTLL